MGTRTSSASVAQCRTCGVARLARHFAAAEVETATAFAMTGNVRPGMSPSQGYIVSRLVESHIELWLTPSCEPSYSRPKNH